MPYLGGLQQCRGAVRLAPLLSAKLSRIAFPGLFLFRHLVKNKLLHLQDSLLVPPLSCSQAASLQRPRMCTQRS